MRISVGGTLTITRPALQARRRKSNTVIFRASNGRSAFVEAAPGIEHEARAAG